jgi:HEAT repeat protein
MQSFDRQGVVAAMDSQVEEIRHQAVRHLEQVFEVVPVDLLIKGLGDASWRVRKAAAHLAIHAPIGDELLCGLTKAIGSEENAGLRNSATEVLIAIGAPAIGVVKKLLESGNRDERKFAADILGEIGQPAAAEALVGALDDEDENVRGAAAEALGRVGDPSRAACLLHALKNDGLLVKMSCLDALKRLEVEVPFDVVRPLLSVRPLRYQALGLLGSTATLGSVAEVVPILIEGLESFSRAERLAAAQALVRLHEQLDRQNKVEVRVAVARVSTDEFCGRLLEMLDGSEEQERAAAVMVLGWTGRSLVVADLIRSAADERLRDAVEASILAIGPKSASILVKMLDELGRTERVLAVELLGRFGQPGSLPSIVSLCLDDDSEVADAAQRALGRMGDPSILSTLVELLSRGDKPVSGAVSSLVLLGERFHDEVIAAIEPLVLSVSEGSRVAAAQVFCGVAVRSDQPRLEQLCGDGDFRIRAVAIQSLGRVGDEDIVDRLMMMLADEHPEVRIAAARALGQRSGQQAASALRVALADAEPRVVTEALFGLGQSGDEGARSSILSFVMSADTMVALAAVRALNGIGWGSDPKVLSRASQHEDSEVVKEVLAGSHTWPLQVARDVLAGSLVHKRWDVRMAAVKKIGAMRDTEGLRMLAQRLADESDPLVREAMEQALRPEGRSDT